jgi:hypothetical protein
VSANAKPERDANMLLVFDTTSDAEKGSKPKRFGPFSVLARFHLARFVQFTGSQPVVGRLAYLTVMPAFVIRNTTPSPE